MGNHTVNEKEKQKTSRPSGQENNVIIVGLEIMQKVKDEFELEAKGKLARAVNPTEYVRIKAYNNKDLMKPKQPIKLKTDKESQLGE